MRFPKKKKDAHDEDVTKRCYPWLMLPQAQYAMQLSGFYSSAITGIKRFFSVISNMTSLSL